PAVKKLRQALGDSVESPRFIETLPRIGYRLLLPINADAVATTRSTSQPVRGVTPRKPLFWLGIGALVFVVASLLGYLFIQRARTQASEAQQKARIAVLPFQNLSGD